MPEGQPGPRQSSRVGTARPNATLRSGGWSGLPSAAIPTDARRALGCRLIRKIARQGRYRPGGERMIRWMTRLTGWIGLSRAGQRLGRDRPRIHRGRRWELWQPQISRITPMFVRLFADPAGSHRRGHRGGKRGLFTTTAAAAAKGAGFLGRCCRDGRGCQKCVVSSVLSAVKRRARVHHRGHTERRAWRRRNPRNLRNLQVSHADPPQSVDQPRSR